MAFPEPPKLVFEREKPVTGGTFQEQTTLLLKGNALFQQGNYAEALEAFRQGSPSDPSFSLWTGLTYWKLNRFELAGPYLRQAQAAFPFRSDLHIALYEVNDAEIAELCDRRDRTSGSDEKKILSQHLAQRYEENRKFAAAAESYAAGLSAAPDYFSLIKVADMYKAAGNFPRASDYYLHAAAISTEPRFAVMWALDSALLAGNKNRVEEVWGQLQKIHSGLDVEWFRARRLRLLKANAEADQVYRELGARYEKKARTARTVRTGQTRRADLLNAAKAYLDGEDPGRGLSILEKIRARSRGPDVEADTLEAEYHFRKKNFGAAMSVYHRHPDQVPMQISYGWALFSMGKRVEALDHFSRLKERFPYLPAVREGYRAAFSLKPWNLGYFFTRLDYGDYQRERDLHTTQAKYQWGRYATAISFTGTSSHAQADEYDFKEQLLGWKVYRRVNSGGGIQLHGLFFQNNDEQTDDGGVVGGKYLRFSHPKLHWDSEVNLSFYSELNSIQTSIGCSYLLTPFWTATFKVEGGFLGGENSIYAETKTPIGLKAALGYLDHNVLLAFEGYMGERVLMVDSDGLYAYNSLDTYREGGSFTIMQKGDSVDFFARIGGTHVTSESIRVKNQRTRVQTPADYHVKAFSLGAAYRF